MKKFLPLAAVAGAIACFAAVGGAQAAPASGNILGKLTTVGEANATVEKAHYGRHHRHWWKKRYYKRHRHHRRWHRWH
ncbi:MAG: hypothetical protein WC829_13705 [Hyphomicrobium sp.]|jgi:hypothetical protein